MELIKFALENNTEGSDKLPCPCYICQNLMYDKADVILNHLSKRQFDRTYTCWHRHGEKREETPSKDAQGHNTEGDRLEDMMSQFVQKLDDNPDVIEELLSDSEKPLYGGCSNYTKLAAVLKLYNLKVAHSWTDKSFTALLELLIDILPSDNVFPRSTYNAKKMLC
ncbi:Phosphoglycerate kinase, partial [Bienertia sinuspersici]